MGNPRKCDGGQESMPVAYKRFIDHEAEFLFVPESQVIQTAQNVGAIPFDVEGAELTHYQGEDGPEHVTFDRVIKKYALKDPALLELAKIVRGADAHRPSNPPPESAGLKAAARGFREISKDDHDNMRIQFPLHDAL